MSPSASPDESTQIARANHLYWETDTGVNGIADELGVSKSTLYEWIRPRWTGEDCARCGSPLVWENRTARDREKTTCPACEEPATAARPQGMESSVAQPMPEVQRLLVAVASGVAIGLAAGLLFRTRKGS